MASDSKNFCIPLQSDSNVNYDPHKYFLNFPMAHLTEAASPTKVCIKFFSRNPVDIEMEEIVRRRITSRDLSNSHFPPSFSWDYAFIASYDTIDCRSTAPITSLDQSIFM